MPNLTYLDLRNNINIDLSKGLQDIQNLLKLKYLYLGPSVIPLQINSFINSLAYHISNLVILQLNDFQELSDYHISEIIDYAVLLEELILCNMNFHTKTIESICSNVPNISKLTLAGSPIIGK
jgi:hypothetical protein